MNVEDMRFAVNRFAHPYPVGADHPQAVPAAKASEITGVPTEQLEELWRNTFGRLLRADDCDPIRDTPTPTEARLGADVFRRHYYPELGDEHWDVFTTACARKGLSWHNFDAIPKMSATGRIQAIVRIHALRRLAELSGERGSIRISHELDPDGRLVASTAVVGRRRGAASGIVGVPETVTERTVYWGEAFAWWAGDAPLTHDAAELQIGQDGKPLAHPPESSTPLCLRMPRVCLGTVAEAIATRMAFPETCEDLLVREEVMGTGSEAAGSAGMPATRRSPRRISGRPAVETVDDTAPATLLSLQRDLMNQMDMDLAQIRREIEAARAVYPHMEEAEFCRKVWADLRGQRRAG